MATCDVVVATTGKPGLITPEMVRPGQVILALSNPVPEIERDAALAAGAAVATDGRATNNMLAFPGLCRGGLDCGIRQFEPPIFRAAAEAIVASVPPGQLLPAPLDRSVHRRVARAVALAAEREGLATREVPPDYMLDTRR
jgi:malate dehydrogenase (oxaloacetate-decarboxylating)